jgi:hypothetical protein
MGILEATVEITKAAVPLSSGTMINHPENVAKFVDTIYRKLLALELERAKL